MVQINPPEYCHVVKGLSPVVAFFQWWQPLICRRKMIFIISYHDSFNFDWQKCKGEHTATWRICGSNCKVRILHATGTLKKLLLLVMIAFFFKIFSHISPFCCRRFNIVLIVKAVGSNLSVASRHSCGADGRKFVRSGWISRRHSISFIILVWDNIKFTVAHWNGYFSICYRKDPP